MCQKNQFVHENMLRFLPRPEAKNKYIPDVISL